MSLKKRVLSATVFFLLFVVGLSNQWLFLVVFLSFMLVQLHEFYRFSLLTGAKPLSFILYLSGALFFVEVFFIAKTHLSYNYLLLVIALLFLGFVVELFRKEQATMQNLAFLLLAFFYIVIPFSLLNFLVFLPANNFRFDYKLIFSYFLIVWSMDIGAYFFGNFFGKHPLFKSISPKKTIEGFLGGSLSVFVVSFAIAAVFSFFTYKDALFFALIIIVFGTLGDLVESKFKRQVGLKDSGTIMPGHGGLLDRFDSTLLSIPFIILYLYI